MTSHESGRLSDALSHVERELAQIWAPDESSPPKARICTANLVVVASASRRGQAVELIDQLRSADVARTFLVSLDPHLPPWAVTTDVSARCQREGEGLLCSERIDLTLGAATISRAASVVSSLCMPEVPTVVLLLDAAPASLTSALTREAARLVVDSESLGLEHVKALADATHAHLVDLSWERLYPVRNVIASCFDDPKIRAAVTAVRRVAVTTTATPGAVPALQARLVVGWLASRLGWRLVSPTSAVDPLHAAVEIELGFRLEGGTAQGALRSVEIDALLGDAHVRLGVSLNPETRALTATVDAEGVGSDMRQISGSSPSLADLVDRAIEDPHADVATRQALAAAAGFPPKTQSTVTA